MLPISVLRSLENWAQLGQGKGWGAETVHSEVSAALALLSHADDKDLVAIDVGANIGNWTSALLAARPSVTVYSFEPSQAAFDILKKRFAGVPAVYLQQMAVGRTEGAATLWANSPGSGLGSLEKRRLDHHGLEFAHFEEVPVTTLDAWLETVSDRPALLKIDVEGRELDVLAGASKALDSVRVVQFEFGGGHIDSRTYFRDFWYFFTKAGFVLFRLSPRGLFRVSSYTELDEHFRTTNFFAVREIGRN
jgi:FkbM family methyltransferase